MNTMEKVVLIHNSGKVSIITLPRNEVNALCAAFAEYKNNEVYSGPDKPQVNRIHVVHNNTEQSFIDLAAIATIQVQR